MKPSISIKKLSKKYQSKMIINDFYFSSNNHSIIQVCGPSGIGKTTLLRCIGGLEKYEGKIKKTGKIAFKFQENRLLPWKTNYENILLPQILGNKKTDQNLFNDIVDLLEIKNQLKKYPSKISGGQRQRISIAQTLISNSDIILLDKPFNNLNTDLSKKIAEKIFAYGRKKNKLIIIASHQNWIFKKTDYQINLNNEITT
jgi:NitT/TauT family transport system ATP-binding protein